MPHWLATTRTVQTERVISRFDPAYWTVNFPRPMMAGVTNPAPDALRVDAVFYRTNDLAGLIWEAEDTHDHVLLRYATARDFRRCRLRFRWRSSGVLPLDAVNGPTLTIEGRDESGSPRTWYVRLWNYASGGAEDAEVAIDFANVAGGFLLPGEADPVWAGDVDRMFVSLCPPGYTGADGVLGAPAEGWVELTGMTCDGSGSVLAIGDVVVPEHGLCIATGYDDCYNLTPARVLRNALQLGYRGAINHYVGMSHYFRLEANSGGFYASLAGGAINVAAAAWHRDFAARAKALGYELIWSLSYELLDQHCWGDWKQRAADGSPALTGYAVFENMQLGDYGNRIPALTFELIADDAPPRAGAIAADIAGGAIVDTGVIATIPGFSAYGSSAREVARLLATLSGARFGTNGGALAMSDDLVPAIAIVDRAMAATGGRGARAHRTIAALESVPRTLSVTHYDAERDYQTSVQRARRPGPGTRDEQIDVPASLSATAAKALAETILARAEIERERRTIALAADAAAIAPGIVVTVTGEAGRWRVIESALESMVTVLTLVRVTPPATPTSASPGRALPAPDRIAGATILHAAELPAPGDAPLAAPRLSVMATGTGTGWRSAALLYSLDGGASWRDGGVSAAPAVAGSLVMSPSSAPAVLFDLKGVIEVDLARADMMLSAADDPLLDSGSNLALAGDELIQFGRAEPLMGNRWRLSRLLRGRRGTEWAIGSQSPGDRFVLLDAASVATIDLPVAALGLAVTVLASGIGDVDAPAATDCVITGASVRPLCPVHLSLATAGGIPTLSWIRRSRAGFRWIDGSDAPLVEESEIYRVTITPVTGAARVATVAGRQCALLSAEATAGTIVAVRQLGALGESVPATLIIA